MTCPIIKLTVQSDTYRPYDFCPQDHLSFYDFTAIPIKTHSLSLIWRYIKWSNLNTLVAILRTGLRSAGRERSWARSTGKQGTQTGSYNTDTLGCALSLYTYTRRTPHVCTLMYTQRQDYMQARDDSRARKDTTVDRLRQVSNNTI